MKCIDVEIALMRYFDFRRNLIVPNVTDMSGLLSFETDMVVLSESGYATGVEIKVSKSDLKADLNKDHISKYDVILRGKPGKQRYFEKLKYFYYAVPSALVEEAKQIVHPDFGILSVRDWRGKHVVEEVRHATFLNNKQWSEEERYKLARLGAMRIKGLKGKIRELMD